MKKNKDLRMTRKQGFSVIITLSGFTKENTLYKITKNDLDESITLKRTSDEEFKQFEKDEIIGVLKKIKPTLIPDTEAELSAPSLSGL